MVVTRPWHAVVPREVAEQASTVALRVAERLRDPGPRRSAGEQAETGVGRALLHGRLDRYQPGRDWAAAAHAGLNSTVKAVEQAGARILGLFGGVSGAAFAARSLSSGGRYGNLLTQLDRGVTGAVTRRAGAIVDAPRGLPAAEVDLVSGMTGHAAYLLVRGTVDPAIEAALDVALRALVAICEFGPAAVPNWFTPPEAMVAGSPLALAFPDGVFNCGLAHGVPGPLAVLALARRAGIEVPGQPDAIKRVAYWLADHRVDDAWGPAWASGVDARGTPGPPRSPWCYGGTGVARALWLAGAAVDDPALRALALEAMAAVYRRPAAQRRLDASPGLCHGVAGLLQVTLRFAHDTGDPRFAQEATTLTRRLLAMVEPERPYLFGTLDGSHIVDEPGLLDGAAGVALALLAAGTDVAPEWDRMLLLS